MANKHIAKKTGRLIARDMECFMDYHFIETKIYKKHDEVEADNVIMNLRHYIKSVRSSHSITEMLTLEIDFYRTIAYALSMCK
ncbi:hypothetical protein [Helicobacter mastomyrinus]|uniref:Uncharacterized protein n=1 Tax=Helicobacter mastomyrinus TaxID=287948 RepID=A0ABZ3F7R7_9HELI|nr:hypothetical protein [uncultured Helicobacter sp.]